MDTTSLQNEFATWENAFGYSPSSFLGFLPDPDPVLRKLGNEAELLNNLMADDQVTTAIASRKSRVLNNQRYEIRPNPKCDEAALKASETTVKRLIEDLENTVMYDCISTILDAPFFGYSVLEVKWEARDGWWHIAGLQDKPWHWFAFDDKGQLTFKTRGGLYQPVPEGKCVVTRHFPTYENPYGLRLLSRCYWPVAFKRGGVQFYVKFVEKYGIPWPIGTAAPGATKGDKDAMVADLRRMVSDAAAVIPHGSSVQIEQPGSDTQLHENFLARWDAAISKVLMGQTLTAEVGNTGSYAAAQTHLNVAEEMAAGDRHLVTTAFNELCWIYNKLNSPSCIAPVFSYIEDRDLEQRVKLDKELYSMGVRFNKSYYQSTYQLEAEHFDVVDEQPTPAPAFARADEQKGTIYDAMQEGLKKRSAASSAADGEAQIAKALKMQAELDRAVDRLMEEVIGPNERLNKAIEKAIKSANSYEEAQSNLDKIIADIGSYDDLSQILYVAMFNAYCFGLADGELPDGSEHLDLTIGLDPKFLKRNRHDRA